MHLPTVGMDNALNNGQSQAGPPAQARAGAIPAIKRRKNMRQVLSGDALSVVRHPDLHDRAHGLPADLDGSPLRGVLHGVVEQIEENLFQGVGIGVDDHSASWLQFKPPVSGQQMRLGQKFLSEPAL